MKLLLYPTHAILFFLDCLLIVRVDFSDLPLESFLEESIEVELVRQLNIEVNPALSISAVNLQHSFSPHLKLVMSEAFAVRVNDFCKLTLRELSIYPLHLLRANQDATTMKLSFFKLSHIFIAITEKLLPVSFQLRVLIVTTLDAF